MINVKQNNEIWLLLYTKVIYLILVLQFLCFTYYAQNDITSRNTYESLDKGIEFFHSLSINGGYVYSYSADLKKKWGEGITDDLTIEVQLPGTPGIGYAYLLAFETTGNKKYLDYAIETGSALIKGQNSYGGWDHKIYFDSKKREEVVSLDDNQTQFVIRFLIKLDTYVDIPELDSSINKALTLMLTSQFENGAWPHLYPEQGNYHDYATFNDNGINDCIDVLIDAYKQYGKPEFLESIKKAGHYIYISQLPPPQPGWAMQYNEFLQPAWARSFEPPAVTPVTTLININTLLQIFLITNNEELLLPIRDALEWVKSTKLPNGKYPRFIEIGTGKTLYYDNGRKRCNSVDELSEERKTGYAYEQDLTELIKTTERNFEKIKDKELVKRLKLSRFSFEVDERNFPINLLIEKVKSILTTQDSLGRWITKNERVKIVNDSGNWLAGYEIIDRINSNVFIENIFFLCKFMMSGKEKNN